MRTLRSYAVWHGGGLLLLALSIAPLVWPAFFREPLFHTVSFVWSARIALIAAPLLAAIAMFLTYPGSRREKAFLVVITLLAAGFCEQVHHQFVDKGHYFGGAENNSNWQRGLQTAVLNLRPDVIPHSYRFLSHSIVAIFEWLGGSFELARGAYRMLFNTLLFAAVIRYARLYLGRPAAVGVVVVTLMIYPITIAWYGGQFVDPVSHLSFVACLYFFARGYEPGVGPCVVLGVLAKESVAALTVCRAFQGAPERRWRAILLAGVYFAVAFLTLVAIRLVINRHSFGYHDISGVGGGQLWANLRGYDEWPFQYFFSLGVLLPGGFLGWRLMDRPFRLTCLVLTCSLVVSSALFSWLNEVRNLVPALVMLAIVNLKYVESRFVRPEDRMPIGLPPT